MDAIKKEHIKLTRLLVDQQLVRDNRFCQFFEITIFNRFDNTSDFGKTTNFCIIIYQSAVESLSCYYEINRKSFLSIAIG